MTTVIPPYDDRTAVGLVEPPADADSVPLRRA